jgi:hypothetical protein
VPVIEGADYSWSRPDPGCLKSRGVRWVGRYLLTSDPAKSLDRAEADRLTAAGLLIVSIHQPSGDKGWMLGGFGRGVAAAKDAVAVGRLCGMPEDRPFTYALDIDPGPLSAAQWDQVRQCLRGAASVHGLERTGIYGGWLALERCLGRYARWGYQTRSWSGGRWHPGATIHQYQHNMALCGGTIDYCRATTADYGQWRPGWSPAGGWWTRPLGAAELAQLRTAFEGALA